MPSDDKTFVATVRAGLNQELLARMREESDITKLSLVKNLVTTRGSGIRHAIITAEDLPLEVLAAFAAGTHHDARLFHEMLHRGLVRIAVPDFSMVKPTERGSVVSLAKLSDDLDVRITRVTPLCLVRILGDEDDGTEQGRGIPGLLP